MYVNLNTRSFFFFKASIYLATVAFRENSLKGLLSLEWLGSDPWRLSITGLLILLAKSLKDEHELPSSLVLRTQVAWPLPVKKYDPPKRKTRMLCVCVYAWIMHLHVDTFMQYVSKYIQARERLCVNVNGCLLVSLETPRVRGTGEDKSGGWKLIRTFYRFSVGAGCCSSFVSSPHLFQHWCLGVLD